MAKDSDTLGGSSLLAELEDMTPAEEAQWLDMMAKHAPPPTRPMTQPPVTTPVVGQDVGTMQQVGAPEQGGVTRQGAVYDPYNAYSGSVVPVEQMGLSSLINPQPVAAAPGVVAPIQAYTAPNAVPGLTPQQVMALGAQGARTAIPQAHAPSAMGPRVGSQVQVVQPTSAAATPRAPIAPRASLAQLLGR